MSIYYFIYITTNLVNGNIYIGKHKTSNLNDGYLGSGCSLLRAINKHGLSNFKSEILCFCESDEQAYWVESLLVNWEFCKRKDTYNEVPGGFGGDTWTGRKHSEASKTKISLGNMGKKYSDETKLVMRNLKLGKPQPKEGIRKRELTRLLNGTNDIMGNKMLKHKFKIIYPDGKEEILLTGLHRWIKKFNDPKASVGSLNNSYCNNGRIITTGFFKNYKCIKIS